MFIENVPAIRLLPMSESDPEFTNFTIEDLQEWFIKELPYRAYNFKTEMITPLGTLILFQYKNSVIASAVLADKKIYPEILDGGYKGAFIFDPYSIAIFTPINKEEMKLIWNTFRSFNQSMQKLDPSKLNQYKTLLGKKEFKYVLTSDLEEDEYQSVVEQIDIDSIPLIEDLPHEKIASNHNSKTNRWKRNYIKAKNAIVQSGYLCEYDRTHLFFKSNRTKRNYVEAHHLIPMEFQEMFDYSLDVEGNIVSLCPLCHKTVHHATLEEKVLILEKLYNERKSRLSKCKIDIEFEELLALYMKE